MVGNRNPILVRRNKSDTWIIDSPLTHFVRAILNVDPPLAALGTAQIPLVPGVHSLCLSWLETTAHRVEHFLWRRIYMARRNRAYCAQTNRHSKHTSHQE